MLQIVFSRMASTDMVVYRGHRQSKYQGSRKTPYMRVYNLRCWSGVVARVPNVTQINLRLNLLTRISLPHNISLWGRTSINDVGDRIWSEMTPFGSGVQLSSQRVEVLVVVFHRIHQAVCCDGRNQVRHHADLKSWIEEYQAPSPLGPQGLNIRFLGNNAKGAVRCTLTHTSSHASASPRVVPKGAMPYRLPSAIFLGDYTPLDLLQPRCIFFWVWVTSWTNNSVARSC
jgi:hypothetical protein